MELESRTLPYDLNITLQGFRVTVKAGSVVEAEPAQWARIEANMPVRYMKAEAESIL